MSFPKAYLGDGLYVRLEPNQTMVLHTERASIGGDKPTGTITHWVALEPEVFLEFLRFANQNGWGEVIARAHREQRPK